jgi:hypothetical protein
MVTVTPGRPTWDEFADHLRVPAPVLVRLQGQPPVDLFVDDQGRRMGLRAGATGLAADSFPHSPFAALRIAMISLEGGVHLEVATTDTDLFPYFFAFCLTIADGIQLDGATPDAALRRALRDWRALFEQLAMLTPERQLGLLGELWLLDRLLDVHGATALDAWTGPRAEAHDFRIEDREFEVKTTSSEHRNHVISSDSQLTASPGRTLYLLSLQFAAGGPNARSLANVVEAIRSRTDLMGIASRFDELLEATFQLSSSTLGHYTKRMQLRSPPLLVAVTESFPRVTRADILSIPRSEMVRISDLRYRVNLEGLGWEDGTDGFLGVLPKESP